jgi:hypothetical protein
MDYVQFTIFFLAIVGLFMWNRAEGRADARHLQSMLDAIHQEMKDFHGRLCAIEERNRGK